MRIPFWIAWTIAVVLTLCIPPVAEPIDTLDERGVDGVSSMVCETLGYHWDTSATNRYLRQRTGRRLDPIV